MNVKEYLEVKEEFYNNIFSNIENNAIGNALLRFHYIKFDPNNEPKFNKLIDTIINHIVYYSYSVSKRTNIDDDSYTIKLYREARNLLRNTSMSGEFGEMILWFLLESVLKAPQVVAKMDLKTNRNDEIKGADGIHVNIENETLEIIFGESKLYQSLSNALNDACKSIETFMDNKQYEREYSLITEHFKWFPNEKQKKILDFINKKIETQDVKIRFACLIGFDWSKYKKLQNPSERVKLAKEFEVLYNKKAEAIKELFQKKFKDFKYSYFEFDVFFLPFKSVEEIREGFKDEL